MSNIELSSSNILKTGGFPTTQLTTPWSNIARSLWLGIVGFTLILCVASLAIGLEQLQRVCDSRASCHPLQLTSEQAILNQQLGLSLDFYALFMTFTLVIFCGICFFVGGLIFWHASNNWMALYVSLFLILFSVGALPIITSLETILPQMRLWSTLAWIVGSWSLPIVLYIFPNGRFTPSWTRWLLMLWMIVNIITLLTEPMPTQGIFSGPPSLFTQIVFIVGGLSQIYRYRRTTNHTLKRQTKWAVFGFLGHQLSLMAIVATLNLVPVLQKPGVEQFVFDTYAFTFFGLIPILFIPLSLAVCILRYQLWDVDVIINRTLVYTLLTAIVVGLYAAIVGGLSAVFHSDNNPVMSLVATGVVAVSFHAIRDLIQRTINRLMFGYRDEPYTVLERLSQQLEPVVAVDEILPTVARTIAQALHLPYVAIVLENDGAARIAANYPKEERTPHHESISRLSLDYHGDHIGQLLLAPRGQDETFSAAESKLLATIARQASIAAYNVRLTEELQRSREELVITREEERRRLRRDLHDGLGPVLAAMSFRLDAIRNLADHDSESTKHIATELKEQVQSSLAQVRRIAYNLRPPALDELGLVGALREHLTTISEGNQPEFTFTASDRSLSLPAAVEVAAYRITLEAVTNVQRHSQATSCHVDLKLSDTHLHVCVTDNGTGIPQNNRAGVGLTAMRERAEELGGYCTITNQKAGTMVDAILPL